MFTSRLDRINDDRCVATATDNRNDQADLQKPYQFTLTPLLQETQNGLNVLAIECI